MPQMDHDTTRRQIGVMNLMACGARDFVTGPDSLAFRAGSKRGIVAKVIVTLDPDDTYTVRYVAMKARTYEIVTDESVSMVYADSLGATVRQMGDR